MQRRSFLRAGGAVTVAAGLRGTRLLAHIPPHNFDKYDFGAGPSVTDRLYQGPFSADDYPSWNVVMALTPSTEVVPNYGMGLITYICDEVGPAHKDGESLAESIEKLVKLPLPSDDLSDLTLGPLHVLTKTPLRSCAVSAAYENGTRSDVVYEAFTDPFAFSLDAGADIGKDH